MPSNPLTHPRTGHDRQFTPRFRPPKATTIADVKPAKTNRSWIPAAGSGSHTALLSQALLADEGTTVLPGPIELSRNCRRYVVSPPCARCTYRAGAMSSQSVDAVLSNGRYGMGGRTTVEDDDISVGLKDWLEQNGFQSIQKNSDGLAWCVRLDIVVVCPLVCPVPLDSTQQLPVQTPLTAPVASTSGNIGACHLASLPSGGCALGCA